MTTKELPPLPIADPVSTAFWDGARMGQLVLQRCAGEDRLLHPPRAICPSCGGTDLRAAPVSGRGTIYTYVVMRDRRIRGFEHRVPYVNVWVELQEEPGLLILANLVDCDPDDDARLVIGASVDVVFESLTPEVTLPQFRLLDER